MRVLKINNTFVMEDANNTVELTPNKDYYLKLPTNSCNRVWISCKKVDEAPGQIIDYGDTVKTPRVLKPYNHGERKPLEDYLDENDRKTYLELLEKAKKAREEANKKQPMTDLEKAKAKFEKAKAALEALKKASK